MAITRSVNINAVQPRNLADWLQTSIPGITSGPIYEQAVKQYNGYATKRDSSPTTVSPVSSGISDAYYNQASGKLNDVEGLYQPGGQWDQAFAQSKRRASQDALARSVFSGMANVYSPEASGAAYEMEARPAWELGRTQGLAGAMAGSASLAAGRGSELYQGGLRTSLAELSANTSLEQSRMASDAGMTNLAFQAGLNNRAPEVDFGITNPLLKDSYFGGGTTLSSPFSGANIWA